MTANSNQDLMRMISVTPMHQDDREKAIITKYMTPIVKADRDQDKRQHKGHLVGRNVEMSDGNGQAMYLFSEFMTEKNPIGNKIIQTAEAYPDFGDAVLVEEQILKDKGDGSGKFDIVQSYEIYPNYERPKEYQQPFGDPAGIAQAVSSNFGQHYSDAGSIPAPTGASLATAAASQADELGSPMNISDIAKRGQSMYQQSAVPASSVQAQPAVMSNQPASSEAVHSSAQSDQAVKSNDLSTPQARQQLIDEIMPDAQSIIDAVSSPMLDVQAKSPNDFLMKSQYEGQLNNMYFMNMDAFGQLQAEHDKLTKELQDFRKKIISNPPAVLSQYQNVKKMSDTIHQDQQRQREQIAAAYNKNLEQLLKSRIDKFKEMYRQKHPDDTEEKLAKFDQAVKPQNDQLDKKVGDARNLAMQQLTQQFMYEHHDDPALQKAFRFMTMKQNMENQFNANQSAMDAMAPAQPVYQQQPQVQQQPSYQAPQQSTQVNDDFSADEDPFAEQQSQSASPSQALASSAVESADQVAEMPNDGTGTDDAFDVLDNVNAFLDQQAESDQAASQAPAESAAPVGQVPNSDPDFADNSGEAANFTDPDDAVKQQEADLNKETASSSVAHLRSGDTDVAFPDDDKKSDSAKQAAVNDPDFADDGIAPADLDDDPFDDLDDDVIEDTKKSKKQKHQKKTRQKKPAKKQHGSHTLRKVALGGAVAGILGIGGIAGASHFGLLGSGNSQNNAKSELASGSSKSQKAPKGTIKVGSVLDVTVNGKQIRVKIVQVQSDGSAIGEASDGSRYSISAAQAKQAANAISHEDKNNNQ